MRCKSFNLAVLTKQGWCLIALVWQAKYFPGDSFLNAQLGSQPSFTLRSVLFVRELLDCFGGLVVAVMLKFGCTSGFLDQVHFALYLL